MITADVNGRWPNTDDGERLMKEAFEAFGQSQAEALVTATTKFINK